MSDQQVTINSRKLDQSIRKSWKCRLVERNDLLLVFVGEFDQAVTHPDLGLIKRGTVSHEYFWLDRWYNVFRFHEPDGELRNYYCNIAMPPIFDNGIVDYVDLDIDIVVWKDRRCEILDFVDFETNSQKYRYSADTISNAQSALHELIELIRRRKFPFNS